MQVLEHERDRPAPRQKLEHPPDRPVQLRPADARSRGTARRRRRRADERPESHREGACLGRIAPAQRLDQRRELRGHRRVLVAVQDPGGISQHLLHGPVRDAVAVRETASPIDPRRVGLGREFPEQSALSDAGRPEQREKRGPARGAHLRPAFAQDGNLVLSADERRARGLPPRSHVSRRDRLPCGDGQRLALHLLRIERLVVDHVRGRAVRRLAHHDAVGRRGGL